MEIEQELIDGDKPDRVCPHLLDGKCRCVGKACQYFAEVKDGKGVCAIDGECE